MLEDLATSTSPMCCELSKCRPFVTEDDGSKDALHYKLGASDFKSEDWCPDSNRTFKLDIIDPMGSMAATRQENIESGFSAVRHVNKRSLELPERNVSFEYWQLTLPILHCLTLLLSSPFMCWKYLKFMIFLCKACCIVLFFKKKKTLVVLLRKIFVYAHKMTKN